MQTIREAFHALWVFVSCSVDGCNHSDCAEAQRQQDLADKHEPDTSPDYGDE